MELFYGKIDEGGIVRLNEEESIHCVRVLRHREGDEICVMDGEGTLLHCSLTDASPKEAVARIISSEKDWGAHPYTLTAAVCPTKNSDRYEWFVEKATEIGIDRIVPVIGDHSERKVIKTERLHKIALSASKQSLKGRLPNIPEAVSVKDFIRSSGADSLKLIAYCDESLEISRRISVRQALEESSNRNIIILIGPEGDFSPEEIDLAFEKGFIPVHLGSSRLRTETAALTAVEAVYFVCM